MQEQLGLEGRANLCLVGGGEPEDVEAAQRGPFARKRAWLSFFRPQWRPGFF